MCAGYDSVHACIRTQTVTNTIFINTCDNAKKTHIAYTKYAALHVHSSQPSYARQGLSNYLSLLLSLLCGGRHWLQRSLMLLLVLFLLYMAWLAQEQEAT